MCSTRWDSWTSLVRRRSISQRAPATSAFCIDFSSLLVHARFPKHGLPRCTHRERDCCIQEERARSRSQTPSKFGAQTESNIPLSLDWQDNFLKIPPLKQKNPKLGCRDPFMKMINTHKLNLHPTKDLVEFYSLLAWNCIRKIVDEDLT